MILLTVCVLALIALISAFMAGTFLKNTLESDSACVLVFILCVISIGLLIISGNLLKYFM